MLIVRLNKLALKACLVSLLTGFINLSVFASTQAPTNVSEARNISSNPSAINLFAGSDEAQTYIEKLLKIRTDNGLRIGGMLLTDINNLFSGGIPHADRWTNNNLFLLDLSLDTEKLVGWKGGLFDIQFLQFNGQDTNKQAGSVQGYNSLPGPPPLNRSELYQLWYRQELLDKKLFIRIGKSVPTFDFGNVLKPVPVVSTHPGIQTVSGLIYTPVFVDPSMLGVMPGYYNSAYGMTINFTPIKRWYLSYAIFDGNLAQGEQTGLTGPSFNGSYFNIAETGFTWLLGEYHKPGNIGIGAWRQTGLIQNSSNLFEHGAMGYYAFGSQRLWYKNPAHDNSGISGFYQLGKNNSSVLPMTSYVGAGLTGFGLIPHRADDSMGLGLSYARLNHTIFTRRGEMMYQVYYQAQAIKNILYLEPALTYIPNPGASPRLDAAWAATMRGILLF